MTAAWWPVPITSESVSSEGISASSSPTLSGYERAVGLRDAQRLGLGAAGLAAVAEEAAVDAGGLQPLVAEHAGAVGVGEGHDHDLAAPGSLDVAADLLDDADGLVAHLLAGHVRAAL